MKYRIEITTEDDTLLFHKNFNTLDELTEYYYKNVNSLSILYRGCILTSYKMYPLENGDYKCIELKFYFNVFPEIPKETKNVDYDLSDKSMIVNNMLKLVAFIVGLILLFPIILVIGACKNVK